MHPRVSVHSICFGQMKVEALFGVWRELGAQRVSFDSGQLLEFGAARAKERLEEEGQGVETIAHVFRTGSLAARVGEMGQEQERLARVIEAARVVGARSVYMLTGGRGAMGWEEGADVFAESLAPCLPVAEAAGVALAIENTHAFHAHAHLANNLRDTITLAEKAGIGICIDMFGCWTEAGLRGLMRAALPRCVLVQVSDYVPGDKSLPCRAVPGDGAIDWPAICSWLQEDGYEGGFDLEMLGPRIDAEGAQQAVARAARNVGAWLQQAG